MEKTAWLLGLFKKSSRKKSIFSQKNIDFFESHTYNTIEKQARALAKLPAEEGFAMGTIMEQVANVDSRDRFKMMFRHLRTEYEKRGLPLMGRFELTPHCTLDCKMCYVHRSDGKYPHRVLTGDEWIDIMDQAIDMGMMRATLTGGECMLHPDFWRIYEHLKQKGVYVTILTNATLIDEDVIRRFVVNPPLFIRISVYGSCPEVYERVTGDADAFFRVDKALRMIDEAKLFSGISLTISRYNMDDFENLWNYTCSVSQGEITIDCDLFNPSVSSGKNYEQYALSIDEQYEIRKKSLEAKGFFVDESIDCDSLEKGVFDEGTANIGMPCAAGLSAFFISYAGEMRPCVDFYLANCNLLQETFDSAWKKINALAKAYKRSVECIACSYFGKCSFCPAVYSVNSCGTNGLPGDKACEKEKRIALHKLLKKATDKQKK